MYLLYIMTITDKGENVKNFQQETAKDGVAGLQSNLRRLTENKLKRNG